MWYLVRKVAIQLSVAVRILRSQAEREVEQGYLETEGPAFAVAAGSCEQTMIPPQMIAKVAENSVRGRVIPGHIILKLTGG